MLFLAWAKVMIASVALPRLAAAAIDVNWIQTSILRELTLSSRGAQQSGRKKRICRARSCVVGRSGTRARSNRRGTQPLFVSAEAGIQAHGTIAAWTEVEGEEQLVLYAADNAAPMRQIGTQEPGWHAAPAWSPDGKRLAWGDHRFRLMVADADSGRASQVDAVEFRSSGWDVVCGSNEKPPVAPSDRRRPVRSASAGC